MVRTAVTLALLALAIVAAPKHARGQTSPNAGPDLSPRQQAAEFRAIASIDRSDIDVCEAQRRYRAAMSRIVTPRQRQELIGISLSQRRRIHELQERTQASLRACRQSGSSCVQARRAVNVVAIQSAFDPSAIDRCLHRAPAH